MSSKEWHFDNFFTTTFIVLQLCSSKLLLPFVCCQISKDLLYSLCNKVSEVSEHPRKKSFTMNEWVRRFWIVMIISFKNASLDFIVSKVGKFIKYNLYSYYPYHNLITCNFISYYASDFRSNMKYKLTNMLKCKKPC